MKLNHKDNVHELFGKLSALTPVNPDQSEWFDSMRQSALKEKAGWKKNFDAYFRGLTNSGHLSEINHNLLIDILNRCNDGNSKWSDFLLPLAWTTCVVAMTLIFFLINLRPWMFFGLYFLMVGLCAFWAHKSAWSRRDYGKKQRSWEILGTISLTGFIAPIFAIVIALLVPALAQKYSMGRFAKDRAALASASDGFPVVRDFALKNHNVNLILGDADESWATTTLNLPMASVASIEALPGYCWLSIYRDNVLDTFPLSGEKNKSLWIQGVMMHELGHCLDVLRDLPGSGNHSLHVRSIAPIDAKGISNIQSYLSASKEDSTKIWREAVADIIAVGYWRLASPADAVSLAAALRQNRSNNYKRKDFTHATMCWIDQAMKASPPVSEKDLFAWADHQRSAANCVIQKPLKRKT